MLGNFVNGLRVLLGLSVDESVVSKLVHISIQLCELHFFIFNQWILVYVILFGRTLTSLWL